MLRAFYHGVLGLAEIPKPPALAARGGCWFRGFGIELHLGVEEDFRPARKAHPGLLVRDLDAWAARLREAGYPVRPDSDFPGMRRFLQRGPAGQPAGVPGARGPCYSRSAGSGISTPSSHPTTPTMIAPQNAAQNPVIWNGRLSLPATQLVSQSSSPLTTSPISPRVST